MAGGHNNSIGNAIDARDRNQRGLGVESIRDMHVGHDFIAEFHQIIAHLVGRNLGQAQVSFGIDQPRIDRHSGHVHQLGIVGNGNRAGGANGSDFSVLHHQHAVLNHAMRNSQELAATQHDGLAAGWRRESFRTFCSLGQRCGRQRE